MLLQYQFVALGDMPLPSIVLAVSLDWPRNCNQLEDK